MLAVVHPHREVDDDLVLRLAQDEADVVGQADDRRRAIEVVLNDFEEFVLAGGCTLGGDATRELL